MESSTGGSRPWRVRRAVEGDVEIIAAFNEAMALETEARRLDPATIRNGVRRLLARPELGFYLVAEPLDADAAADAEGVVGCLLVTYEWSDWRDGLFYWIQSVYVRPEARGQSVFTTLYRAVERLARDHGGVCGLRLYVERSNLGAQRTYARLGMVETEYRLWEAPLT